MMSSAADQEQLAKDILIDTPGVSVTDAGNRVIYTPEYFSQFNVVSASDQLDRIPGIQGIIDSGDEDSEQRGFGSAGDQILINGRRVSGKSNDVESVLDRIQARQVARIEVIRGAVPGLDVRSLGRIVNVVLEEDTLSTGYGSWQAFVEKNSNREWAAGIELNYNGKLGALNYLVTLEADDSKQNSNGTDMFYSPAGVLFESQLENENENSTEYSFSTNTSFMFSNGDNFNLNMLLEREDDDTDELSSEFAINNGNQIFLEDFLDYEKTSSIIHEIGGDYEREFPNGNIFTLLFVYSAESSDERSELSEFKIGESRVLEEVQEESSDVAERIIRSAFTWTLDDVHNLESGVELAINTAREQSRLFEYKEGALQEVALFNQGSTIEETRYEAFVSHTWKLRPTILLENSLDIEYSEIEQRGGDVEHKRNFFYLRPRIVVRYDLNEQNQVRGRIERRISQLDFGSFVASFTNDANRFDVITAGNPELEPEKTWEYELTFERRLARDLGLFSLSLQYDDIADRIGRIPLLVTGLGGEVEEAAAQGNIGNGYAAALEMEGSLRLDWLNLSNAVLDTSLRLERTRISDPFTGEKRRFSSSSPYSWAMEYRQDTDWNNLAYGLGISHEGPDRQFDRDYYEESQDSLSVDIFAEFEVLNDFTVRLSIEDMLNGENERERYQFEDSRSLGFLKRRELRTSRSGREINLSIQSTF